jgi:hypothetical protein
VDNSHVREKRESVGSGGVCLLGEKDEERVEDRFI